MNLSPKKPIVLEFCDMKSFRKQNCYITLVILKRGSSCCAVSNFRHSNFNLAFSCLKLHNTFILRNRIAS